MDELKLYDSEYRFMDLIWELEPVKSMELARTALQRLGWKKSTCYTVLKKLEDRGFVENRDATVTSLVAREQVQLFESEGLIEKNFGGSLPAFLNAFLKDKKLSRQEAEEIRRLIEDAVDDKPEEPPLQRAVPPEGLLKGGGARGR